MRGDLIVKSCKLKPINSSKRYYVNSTDEYPILFIIAALTEGVSVFKVDHCRICTRTVRNASKGIMRHVGIIDVYRITIGLVFMVVWCGLRLRG